ncbi:hypothetical protein R1flu_023675 [Riccia fluitans]|uniref:Uncharacterized protein n=1 Tax=Riccia fluitans TaxID=41844 RepID=A0ABD1XWS5_9MARC
MWHPEHQGMSGSRGIAPQKCSTHATNTRYLAAFMERWGMATLGHQGMALSVQRRHDNATLHNFMEHRGTVPRPQHLPMIAAVL